MNEETARKIMGAIDDYIETAEQTRDIVVDRMRGDEVRLNLINEKIRTFKDLKHDIALCLKGDAEIGMDTPEEEIVDSRPSYRAPWAPGDEW